jgi:hypothetical protein
VARWTSTSTRLRVGSGAGLELTNEGAHRPMRLGSKLFSGRYKTFDVGSWGGVCPRHPDGAVAFGTCGLGAPMSVSSAHRIEVTTPWTPYPTSVAVPHEQRPPNNRLQATAGGLGGGGPARWALAHRA